MKPEHKEFIGRLDALASAGLHHHEDPSLRSIGHDALLEWPKQHGVAERRQAASSLGLLSERELQHIVTAHFEYPALRRPLDGGCQELVAAHRPYSAKGRAIRYLAARIMLEAYNGETLCFSVAGPHRGAGATYVVANLGVVFSELGLRTLIVDANLKRPRLDLIFDRPQAEGLATVISGDNADPLSIISLLPYRSLALLAAGHNASRSCHRLGNGMLGELLTGLRQAYDVVICDSPPLSADGSEGCEVVAAMCGSVVTVFRKDRTRLSSARRLLDVLDAVGGRHLGSVLNTAEREVTTKRRRSRQDGQRIDKWLTTRRWFSK
jgi:protein-tyrosine kinase